MAGRFEKMGNYCTKYRRQGHPAAACRVGQDVQPVKGKSKKDDPVVKERWEWRKIQNEEPSGTKQIDDATPSGTMKVNEGEENLNYAKSEENQACLQVIVQNHKHIENDSVTNDPGHGDEEIVAQQTHNVVQCKALDVLLSESEEVVIMNSMEPG
ncbi:Hypothetical predicted protein [Olea europaea subsp. europaea]|uniref:Uncharacterized protein n=1 Tax=Olea europaea subsp. europaea TaxID=158383 RepID=A0A8S0P7Q1_OLEEU|nr:Hypothetical predicted protein [Olea europaea subsp. europaea]